MLWLLAMAPDTLMVHGLLTLDLDIEMDLKQSEEMLPLLFMDKLKSVKPLPPLTFQPSLSCSLCLNFLWHLFFNPCFWLSKRKGYWAGCSHLCTYLCRII